jgi:predicted O-methyltransferase YrrM
MTNSTDNKLFFGLMKAITHPRSSLSWIRRGHLAKDPVFVSHTYWFDGTLPRVPLATILPNVEQAEVVLPRAFHRKSGTSINVEEACHLGAIARRINATKALEIGTYDGNTALVLAANLAPGGQVVTVDLPPNFDTQKQDSLAIPDVELNLTPRDQLGRQYQGNPLSSRIRQVYGDTATLDWSKLGGPFDMIFIDGCHSEAYVRSDSQNALNHLSPGGVIVWHDYCTYPGVAKVVDQLAHVGTKMKVYAIEGTRLAVGIT